MTQKYYFEDPTPLINHVVGTTLDTLTESVKMPFSFQQMVPTNMFCSVTTNVRYLWLETNWFVLRTLKNTQKLYGNTLTNVLINTTNVSGCTTKTSDLCLTLNVNVT